MIDPGPSGGPPSDAIVLFDDLIFHPPRVLADGKVQAGSFTVLHNGVLIQDHIPVKGEATTAAKFSGATPKGPVVLQDHGNPVRYRNIWIRPL